MLCNSVEALCMLIDTLKPSLAENVGKVRNGVISDTQISYMVVVIQNKFNTHCLWSLKPLHDKICFLSHAHPVHTLIHHLTYHMYTETICQFICLTPIAWSSVPNVWFNDAPTTSSTADEPL